MKISVTFRNREGENWHKDYIDQKLKKLEKYIDTPVE
ncbi:MAG: ribosomal subunit interface protein, partial [Syntrophaceae bacterium]|nr:ribosomal subunit interface protein [Syntrophaceae bacterium]